MEGSLLISILNTFLLQMKDIIEIKILNIFYDYEAFGNYEVVFGFTKFKLKINCDRGSLTVVFVYKKNEKNFFDFIEELGGKQTFESNAFKGDKQLNEILNFIKKTIGDVDSSL